MKMNVSIRLIVLLAISFAGAFAADVTGKWTGQMGSPNGDGMSITFDFKQDGTKLTGTADGPGGQTLQLKDGKVEGDKISFTVSFDGGGGDMKILKRGNDQGRLNQAEYQDGWWSGWRWAGRGHAEESKIDPFSCRERERQSPTCQKTRCRERQFSCEEQVHQSRTAVGVALTRLHAEPDPLA